MDWVDYDAVTRRTAGEIVRVLHRGGRAWVNVAPVITPAGEPRHDVDGMRIGLTDAWNSILGDAGLSIRDWVAWVSNRHPATSWGSWESPSAPNLRGAWE